MKKEIDLTDALLDTWKITHQVSVYLIRQIPADLWDKGIPGYKRKTIAMLAIHLHHTRCNWIRSIGRERFSKSLTRLEPRHATRKDVVQALKQSQEAMLELLHHCLDHGGQLPSRPAWLNFPADVVHLLAYFVAHEAHHRGQITMAIRQLSRPLTPDASGGLWQWNRRLKEATGNQ